MPDERSRTESIQPTNLPPPDDSDIDGLEPAGPYERFIVWAAELPWWAIILGVFAVVVMYSMLTSAAYRRVIDSLTDNPKVTTDDLFQVVQVVGEPTMVVGRYVGETQDSVETVIDQLLSESIDRDIVTRSGFIEGESSATLTIRTADGLLTIPKTQIVEEQRTEDRNGTQVTLTYIDRVTVTGIMTDRDDETMTVRTVNEESVTFDPARILSRDETVIPCADDAGPDCEPQTQVTVLRQGETFTGRLKTLSNTNLRMELRDGSSKEIRRNDIDTFSVPTLTVAVNEARAGKPVAAGEEVRIAFVDGTDITAALDQLKSLDEVPVPLRYGKGQAIAVLVGYPDVESALRATGAGEVSGLLYLDNGPDRMVVQEWVHDNPDAGVELPTPPRECESDCQVTVKLVDEEFTGRVADESTVSITIVTQEPEYVVIERDKIVDDRRMEPGVCALNNLRGCNAGIFLTLRVTFQAYALALIIGLFFGLLRVQRNPVLYAVSTLYVEVIRGIPLLVILLYAGFVVSPWLRDHTPLELSDEYEAVLGLAFGYGAFIAEIFRAGIQSISRGQMEAARSLGMSYPQAMRYVVLPQAVRVVLPPLGNDFIAMLKDSALISVLALPDLLQLGRLYVSRTFRAFEGYNTVAILYLIMTLFLSMLVRIIERRTRLPG